ncbi:ABC transporter ATP-binding protein [Paramaledivibacter caminithermalis]|jgi:oligopeptide/dipeptide ABC transporter ATP-binding protein|uniref:Oligopeptide transport system ATP-binding protein n=1 Tax=Paramaledivibacter caminithermalis (strain DSM 15212 / CIP 107654 / DViRD3) TaxID=1121301 RepID=A0A1M6P008_PARC5|nr:ABC transporter ATP-binding protein [Paramaledivibacter caminithermalis]SHK01317.1 oligopeptide transport system ATP-binding protein [Paramaledivibacter caminithermalis DSM 15212]
MKKKLLQVNNLRTYFHTFKGTVKAVDNISFDIDEGEILGVVGESGGGKSITGFSIIKLIDEPGKIETGEIIFDGQDLMKKSESQMNEIRGKDISMVFQDPMTSLNPVYTIGEQMEEVLILHEKLTKDQRKKRCIELLKAVGISNPESRLKSYPHQFSGGMRQRVVIAIALAANPKLIIADEPTTALDVTIQAQILRLMTNLVKEQGCSLMLITHDLAVVSEIADRINVMYCGKIVETGSSKSIVEKFKHPYTKGLISSIPDLDKDKDRLETIPGIVPNMFNLPKGCNFSPRCKYCKDICKEKEPELVKVDEKHYVACHFPLREGEK